MSATLVCFGAFSTWTEVIAYSIVVCALLERLVGHVVLAGHFGRVEREVTVCGQAYRSACRVFSSASGKDRVISQRRPLTTLFRRRRESIVLPRRDGMRSIKTSVI